MQLSHAQRQMLENACFTIITPASRKGTGFFISREGYALTAHHTFPLYGAWPMNSDLETNNGRQRYPGVLTNHPSRSYPDPANDVEFLSMENGPKRFGYLKLDRKNKLSTWWSGREIAVCGFCPGKMTIFEGNVTQKLSNVRVPSANGFSVEIALRPPPGSSQQTNLLGLSGSPVFDCRTQQVVALVHSYRARRVGGNWIVYATPIHELDRLFAWDRSSRLKRQLVGGLSASAVLFLLALLVIFLWPYVLWLLWPPNLHMEPIDRNSWQVQPDGGMVKLVGESENIAGYNRQVVLLVSPDDYPGSWFLQQGANGIFEVSPDGEWRGQAQLGSADYPPEDGDGFALAFIIAWPKEAQTIRQEFSKVGEGKDFVLPPDGCGVKVLTWRHVKFTLPKREEVNGP